jgi:hypothetical protein
VSGKTEETNFGIFKDKIRKSLGRLIGRSNNAEHAADIPSDSRKIWNCALQILSENLAMMRGGTTRHGSELIDDAEAILSRKPLKTAGKFTSSASGCVWASVLELHDTP